MNIQLSLSPYQSLSLSLPQFQRTSFATPARSLLKTITMTTGEFEFDSIFRQAPGGVEFKEINMLGEIPYPPISYMLWIAFIILMPILLTNLLVGLLLCQKYNDYTQCSALHYAATIYGFYVFVSYKVVEVYSIQNAACTYTYLYFKTGLWNAKIYLTMETCMHITRVSIGFKDHA